MFNIPKNMCVTDRVLRSIVGIAMVYAALFERELISSTLVSVIFIVIGTIFVFFSILGRCPVYKLANISTKPLDNPVNE